jgi:hypothetical protein
MPERRNAADGIPGEIESLTGGSPANGDLTRDCGKQTQVDLVAP